MAFEDLIYIINSDNTSTEIETYLNKTLEGWKKDTGDKFKNIENLLNNEIAKARKKELKINPLPWEVKKESKESYEKWERAANQGSSTRLAMPGTGLRRQRFRSEGSLVNARAWQAPQWSPRRR